MVRPVGMTWRRKVGGVKIVFSKKTDQTNRSLHLGAHWRRKPKLPAVEYSRTRVGFRQTPCARDFSRSPTTIL